jgi:CRISPR/Cas system CMR subunit Cmr4 (Cas7 group RAMP superfamily)
MVFDAQLAVTPDGRPLAMPIPVAPVVVWVTGVRVVLRHKVEVEEAELTVFVGSTVIVPVASIDPHPPVN